MDVAGENVCVLGVCLNCEIEKKNRLQIDAGIYI